ncbi:hypothetical protein AQUCO_02000321v1 [Aquilegia coerulea]|uniref:Uncharacterized protein n=1 Tax=Aquilegia coerulea TaxID=218851 RepID=A0A2G5DGZ0_AQUCA|nr:hypothetical protein AQUCO_02000321v1 [Aquilegia coerulea]
MVYYIKKISMKLIRMHPAQRVGTVNYPQHKYTSLVSKSGLNKHLYLTVFGNFKHGSLVGTFRTHKRGIHCTWLEAQKHHVSLTRILTQLDTA